MIVFSDYEKVNAIVHIVIYVSKSLTTVLGPPPDGDKLLLAFGCALITVVISFLVGGLSVVFLEWAAG